MAALGIIPIVASLAGAAIAAQGTIAAGKAQQQAAEYEAAQLEIKAKDQQAAAQREAQQYERKKELALSSLQATSAGSGFSATDPTSLAIADEIAKYGTYQEQMAQYGGLSERAGLEAQAQLRQMEGRAAMKAARTNAVGTIIGGISGMAGKWGSMSGGSMSGGRYG